MSAKLQQAFDELEGLGAELEFLEQAMRVVRERTSFFESPKCLKLVLKLAKSIHEEALASKGLIDREDEVSTVVEQTSKAEEPAPDTKEAEEEEEEDSGPAPVNNGGTTDRYTWDQTLKDVSVAIDVPAGIRGRDLNVVIRPRSLFVQIKGQEPIVRDVGKLWGTCAEYVGGVVCCCECG